MTGQTARYLEIAIAETPEPEPVFVPVCIDPTHWACDPMTCIDAATLLPEPCCEDCGYVAGHPSWCATGRITS